MRTQSFSRYLSVVILLAIMLPLGLRAQDTAYRFTTDVEVSHTSMKHQARTGTCWCHATLSLLESELIRTEKGEFDLAEIFVVRHAYTDRARLHVRLHGSSHWVPGGQAHDVIDQIRDHGIVPEHVYPGRRIGEDRLNHGEVHAVLSGMLEGIVARRGGRITQRWPEAVESVLDVYFGKLPETFAYEGKTYTPKSFSEHIGINPDDYIELTSYSIYPYFKSCYLEVPDNWTHNNQYYNLPLDDLERCVEHALKNGYSLAWDGDVSERYFNIDASGACIVPAKDWETLSRAEREAKISEPVEEKEITEALRRATFDDWTSKDDHLMHMVGLVHDQKGNTFYKIKDSYGSDRPTGGYVYFSRPYFRLKTVNVMVNKNALPSDVKARLKL